MKKAQVYVIGSRWWDEEREPAKHALKFVLPPETPFKSNEYYRIRDVADTLQVSYITVKRWIARGDLEAQSLGREYRILGKKLIEYLGGHKMRDLSAVQKRAQNPMDSPDSRRSRK